MGRHSSTHSTTRGKWHTCDLARGSEVTGRRGPNAHGPHSDCTILSPCLRLWHHGELSKISCQRRGDSGMVYRWFCTTCRHHPRGQRQHGAPLGRPCRTVVTGNPPGAERGAVCVADSPARIIHQFLGCGQWFASVVRDSEGTCWKNGDKERGMWIDLSEWAKKCENICDPHECSPRGDLSTGGF